MKIDQARIVAFALPGGFWLHPRCAPPAAHEDRQFVLRGTGLKAHTYLCENCGEEIHGVNPNEEPLP